MGKTITMVIKSAIKFALLNLRLARVNCYNIKSTIHIGVSTIIETDGGSNIFLNENVSITDFVKITAENNGSVYLGHNVYIGDFSIIRASHAEIRIGNNCMIAQQVKLISTNHAYKDRNVLMRLQHIDQVKKGIVIGNDCWLGAGCTILPGVKIADGAVIGANTVVTKDIPEYAVVVGNPGRIISYRL